MNAVAPATLAPICPYCSRLSVFMASSAELYHGHNFGPVWICPPCGAWVGCHKGTNLPLGRLANAELRTARREVHNVFDPLWLNVTFSYPGKARGAGNLRKAARVRAYGWLAEQLGISMSQCHVGQFDLVTCRRAMEVIERERPDVGSISSWSKARGEEVAS